MWSHCQLFLNILFSCSQMRNCSIKLSFNDILFAVFDVLGLINRYCWKLTDFSRKRHLFKTHLNIQVLFFQVRNVFERYEFHWWAKIVWFYFVPSSIISQEQNTYSRAIWKYHLWIIWISWMCQNSGFFVVFGVFSLINICCWKFTNSQEQDTYSWPIWIY